MSEPRYSVTGGHIGGYAAGYTGGREPDILDTGGVPAISPWDADYHPDQHHPDQHHPDQDDLDPGRADQDPADRQLNGRGAAPARHAAPSSRPTALFRRRSPRVAVALAVGALAAFGAGAALARQGPPDTSRDTPTASSDAQSSDHATTRRDLLRIVRFADLRHGYAISVLCPQASDGLCGHEFRRTTDSGRTWHTMPFPSTMMGHPWESPMALSVVGADGLLLAHGDERWFSADGGQSWRVPASAAQPVAAAPAGAAIEIDCDESGPASCGPYLAVDPHSGARSRLATQPDLVGMASADPLPHPRDGSIWITGRTRSGQPAVAVSQDRGRHWRTVALPAPLRPLVGTAIVTADGRSAYAFVRADGPESTSPAFSLESIYATTDSGAHWRRVQPMTQPRRVIGFALLSDGRLLVTTDEFGLANVRYSDDGGRSFPRLIQSTFPELGRIEDANGRLVAEGVFGGYYTSIDGTHWDRLAPY